jgi:hypothetical protein
VLPGGSARVRATGTGTARRAGFAGLSTCGSVWSCPVCAEKILARRQDEIRRALSVWGGLGGRVAFVTLTMRHRKGQPLGALWDSLSYAWGATTSGRRWRETCERYGVDGWLRVVETTEGAHGWHVHVHAAILLPVTTTADDVDRLHARMVGTWTAALRRRGLTAAPGGQHAKLWTGSAGDPTGGSGLGSYFAKGDYVDQVDAGKLALELARGDLKTGKGGNRTPFQILGDFIDQGDADDLDLWTEWEKASKGRRFLTWSRGLRDRLLEVPEQTDEEIVLEELGTADDDLVEIPAAGLQLLARFSLHDLVLDLAERDDGGAGLREWLTHRGIPWKRIATKVGAA